MELIEQVRAKVIEAVPEIRQDCDQGETCTECNGAGLYERAITLADVLRAINNQHISVNSVKGNFMFDRVVPGDDRRTWNYTDKDGQRCVWNLALPLDEQEPEVIEFLARVLGITS